MNVLPQNILAAPDPVDVFYAKDQLCDNEGSKKQKNKKRKQNRKPNQDAPEEEEKCYAQESPHDNKEEKDRAEQPTSREQLLAKARVFCASADEWIAIRDLNSPQLEAYLEQKAYENHAKISRGLVQVIHSSLAEVMDQLSRANGHVKQEIRCDLTLAEALHSELANILYLINNRIKIIALLAVDTWNGKQKQRRLTNLNQLTGSGAADSAAEIEEAHSTASSTAGSAQ